MTPMDPTHSALIVAIPEAEPLVGHHRERLDSAAGWGIPAHVTVMFPFLPPADIDEHVLHTLTAVAASVPAFFLSFDTLNWFGDRVVWLAPTPSEPFRQLTAAVATHFPGVLPYDGEFDEVIPHLTLGHDHPHDVLTAAAGDVATKLPLTARADTLRLITGRREEGSSWLTRALFPLG
jgi:2'-5' RNA ligase